MIERVFYENKISIFFVNKRLTSMKKSSLVWSFYLNLLNNLLWHDSILITFSLLLWNQIFFHTKSPELLMAGFLVLRNSDFTVGSGFPRTRNSCHFLFLGVRSLEKPRTQNPSGFPFSGTRMGSLFSWTWKPVVPCSKTEDKLYPDSSVFEST
jgi:hypothetical protein